MTKLIILLILLIYSAYFVLIIRKPLIDPSTGETPIWDFNYNTKINSFELSSDSKRLYFSYPFPNRVIISLLFFFHSASFWKTVWSALWTREVNLVLQTKRPFEDSEVHPQQFRLSNKLIKWLRDPIRRTLIAGLSFSHLLCRVIRLFLEGWLATEVQARPRKLIFSSRWSGMIIKNSWLAVRCLSSLGETLFLLCLSLNHYRKVEWLVIIFLVFTCLKISLLLFKYSVTMIGGLHSLSNPLRKVQLHPEPKVLNGKFIGLLKSKLIMFRTLFSWHPGLKSRNWFFLPLLHIGRLISGQFSAPLISSLYLLTLRISRIVNRNGLAYTARYLKYCSLLLMKFIADEKSVRHSGIFDLKISVTNRGLPRIIPTYFRGRLRSHDPYVIRILLTVFNLYRVLPYKGKVKLDTITDPWKGVIPMGMLNFLPNFWKLVHPKKFSYRWDPFVLSSMGSFSSRLLVPRESSKNKNSILDWRRGNSSSGFITFLFHLSYRPELMNSILWFLSICSSVSNENCKTGLTNYVELIKKFYSPSFLKDWGSRASGRLAYKEEPGKVRTFAMVDCVTQWTLAPLHDWLFSILRSLGPTDGTFDQDGAADHIMELMREHPTAFSYDLSAATDRLPLILQIKILDSYLPNLGLHWANLLVNRDYSVPGHPTLDENSSPTVRYATGQPMGALSSWAMLALTHHFIVQFAASQVYPSASWFNLYVVLGDDIVIFDKEVAKKYLRIMQDLDVGINLNKSLTTGRGYCEFAKRFLSSQGDLSGLPLKFFSSLPKNWSSVLSLLSPQRNVSYTTFLRFLGYGSLSSGNFKWTWSPLWSQKRWFYEAFVLIRTSPVRYLQGLSSYLYYAMVPFLKHQFKVIEDFDYSRTEWTRPSKAYATKKKIRAVVKHKGQMTSDAAYLGLRLLAGRFFDVMILPFSQDHLPRGNSNPHGEQHLSLVDPQKGVAARAILQDHLFNIFYDSRFFHSLSFFVSRSLSSTIEIMEKWKDSATMSFLLLTPDILLSLYKDSPSSLMLDKGKFRENMFLRHVFASKIPEEFNLQKIDSPKDFSRLVDLKARMWYKFRSESPPLLPIMRNTPSLDQTSVSFRDGSLWLQRELASVQYSQLIHRPLMT